MSWWFPWGPRGQPGRAPLLLLCRRCRPGMDGEGQGQGKRKAENRGRWGDCKGRWGLRCGGVRPGSRSSYTGLPRPSQWSSSFWPSRGCGGSGLIFAVGVSVEKEMMSVHRCHTVQEKTKDHSPPSPRCALRLRLLPVLGVGGAGDTDLQPQCLTSKFHGYYSVCTGFALQPHRGRISQALSVVDTEGVS